jgi:hypothetical protein
MTATLLRLFFFTIVATFFALPSARSRADCSLGDPAKEVSIISLIADPGRFDGQRVEVRAWGVVESEFSAGAIFPSKEDTD